MEMLLKRDSAGEEQQDVYLCPPHPSCSQGYPGMLGQPQHFPPLLRPSSHSYPHYQHHCHGQPPHSHHHHQLQCQSNQVPVSPACQFTNKMKDNTTVAASSSKVSLCVAKYTIANVHFQDDFKGRTKSKESNNDEEDRQEILRASSRGER